MGMGHHEGRDAFRMQQVQKIIDARVDDRLPNQRERAMAYGARRLGEALGYLMREAIMQAISGHQWPSVAISGHQWPSVVISDNQ
jgi:hypothetical protein